MNHARQPLPSVRLAAFLAGTQVGAQDIDQGPELGFVVEGGYDHVTSFVPVGVVPIVANDVTDDLVVVGVYLGHTFRMHS